jgi:hypothetical protein
VRYCDDFLFVGKTAAQVKHAMLDAIRILNDHGLVVNPGKTEGPAQSISFLGLGIDSRDRVIFVPEDKVSELLQLSGDMRTRTFTQRRHLQSLVGKFSFVAAALSGARPFFRQLIDASKGYSSPHSRIPVSQAMRDDLKAWSVFLKKWNRRMRWHAEGSFVIDHDASGGGFGFLLQGLPPGFDVTQLPGPLQPGKGFAGYFSTQDLAEHVSKSIQWAELFAIVASLALYGPFMRDSHVHVRTDNKTDVCIIQRQSTASPRLLPLLRSIFLTCAHYNIDLSVSHVPGTLNTIPDYLSRPAKHLNKAHTTHRHRLTHNFISIHYINSSSFQASKGVLHPPTFCFPLSS